jgi:hypothetical protein
MASGHVSVWSTGHVPNFAAGLAKLAFVGIQLACHVAWVPGIAGSSIATNIIIEIGEALRLA